MPVNAPNPFAPAASINGELGVFGDAVLLKKGFLYRSIAFNPLQRGRSHPSEPFSIGNPETVEKSLPPNNGQNGIDHGPVTLLTYNGWWFVQRVHLNRKLVWWAISWLKIQRLVELEPGSKELIKEEPGSPKAIKIEIDFARGLQIRRFRVWLDREIRYDEIS